MLNEQLINLAKKNDLDKSFNYYEPDLVELSKGINKISLSTVDLKEKETYLFTSKDQTIIIDNQSKQIDIEKLEDALTDKVIENTIELIYKIKKPDFLGDSQWEFKLGKLTPKAKILHLAWLAKFHSGEVVVIPGDALQVKVHQCFKYNKHGILISEKLEITEVLNVIHNRNSQNQNDDQD